MHDRASGDQRAIARIEQRRQRGIQPLRRDEPEREERPAIARDVVPAGQALEPRQLAGDLGGGRLLQRGENGIDVAVLPRWRKACADRRVL